MSNIDFKYSYEIVEPYDPTIQTYGALPISM